MNKNSINFITTLIVAIILSLFLPWWSIMLASFITGVLISLKRGAVFFVPFLAIAIFWMVYSFLLSSSNDFIMARKIAVLLPLQGNPYLLILITGLIGGIAAGIAGVLGKQFKTVFLGSQ